MKEEALKLADELENIEPYAMGDDLTLSNSSAMIRKLVEELDRQTKPTITKLDGKVVAVTMTDDEHRVVEVLWEAPKPLSDEEIDKLADEYLSDYFNMQETINFAKAIEERHGIK